MFLLERLTEVIAPFACLQCGYEGSLVCSKCRETFCTRLQPRCYRCLNPSKGFVVCRQCAPRTYLRHVWMTSRLNGLPETLIHTFKFERAQATAPLVADFMAQAVSSLPHSTLVIPVPTATSRIRERGYDHAALLARALARRSGLRYIKAIRRIGQSRQVGATRVQRLAQLQGAFRVTKPSALGGASILLVDDVVTTGATLEEAAKVLYKAGARRIDAVVFAQK